MNSFNLYKKSLKNSMTEDPVDLFFFRPIGFVLAKLFMNTSITPNGVTAISTLFGIMAGIFYSAGKTTSTLIAAILLLISNILDCTDGQLARLKGTSSKLGRILDGLSDYATGIAIFVGIVIGYSGRFYTLPVWWGLVIVAGISHILQSFLVDTYRSRFITWTKGQSQSLKDEHKEFEEKSKTDRPEIFNRFINNIYRLYLRINIKLSPAETRTAEKIDYEYLIQKNKLLVRGWSLIGPSTKISIAVIASIINRPDLFFLTIVIPINLFALTLYILQSIVDSKKRG
jgi:hypothetical protein